MTDNRALTKPEKGETKEQFKRRLKAALGVGDADHTGRTRDLGEVTEGGLEPSAGE